MGRKKGKKNMHQTNPNVANYRDQLEEIGEDFMEATQHASKEVAKDVKKGFKKTAKKVSKTLKKTSATLEELAD